MKKADGSTVEVDIYEPRSTQQAIESGKGTNWSISSKEHNFFIEYYQNRGHTFYIIIPRDGSGKVLVDISPASHGGGTKYWDQNDNEIKIQLIHAAGGE